VSRQSIRYQPALDGVRALAVSAVLLFHGGIGWMSGGYLGVSVFFTLSGFLITSLLLAEHERHGSVDAKAFYARRARRLLPASLTCLVGVCLLAAAGWFKGVTNLRRDVLGALFQVFNWVKLGAGESYADLTSSQAGFRKPLDHYWSLAIEEQFYWMWPLAFLGLVVLARRWRTKPLRLVAVLTALAAVAAPVIARVWGPDAAYWATPARISEILAGALVACWVAGRTLSPRLAVAAPVALVALAAACALFPSGHGPAYQGAMPLVAAASAALILGLQVEGPLTRALGMRPLVALGKVSYGVYLYHWPVFVLVDRQHWDIPVGLSLLVKCAITGVVTVGSYFLIERPVRRNEWLVPVRTLVAAAAGTAVVLAAVLLVPVTSKYYGADPAAAGQVTFGTDSVAPLVPVSTPTTPPSTQSPTTSPVVVTTPAVTTTTQLVPPRPVRIIVVGDSTAEATGAGLVAWAAANPTMAQVELVTGPGCGLVLGGYIDLSTGTRNVDKVCSPYVKGIIPQKIAALHPDVVMVMTTVWDVLDRRLTRTGPSLPPMDPSIEAHMTDSLGAFTDELLALGVPRVAWIDEPAPLPNPLAPDDSQSDPLRHAVLHRVIATVAATRPQVRVLDLATWLTTTPLAASADARPDHVHWTSDASLQIATEYLGAQLVRAALT
jgi:peptidoglycan/LPS O-acetylase OafA/YrhL